MKDLFARERRLIKTYYFFCKNLKITIDKVGGRGYNVAVDKR